MGIALFTFVEQEDPKQNTDSTSASPDSLQTPTLVHTCAHAPPSHASSSLACPGGWRVPALEGCPTSDGEHLGEGCKLALLDFGFTGLCQLPRATVGNILQSPVVPSYP